MRTLPSVTSLALLVSVGWHALACASALAAAPPEATQVVAPAISDCRIGFAGLYKVGYWTPVFVDVAGAGHAGDLRIEVMAIDNDGIETMNSAEVSEPSAPAADDLAAAAANSTTHLYIKVGRVGSEVRVTLKAADRVIDRWTLQPGVIASKSERSPESGNRSATVSLPANSELIVAFGAEPFGLAGMIPTGARGGNALDGRVIQLDRVDHLPTEWFGYEGVDVLVFSADNVELGRALASDGRRFAALRQWIELGGRLVLLCGASARQLLGADGPLTTLAPGRFVDMVRMTQTSPLEHFAGSSSTTPIAARGARQELFVPQFADVEGVIDAYVGRRPRDLPLVVRSARGLGEIAFAGFDLTAAPLAAWAGRPAFLQSLLRPYAAEVEATGMPQTLVTLGYDDLSGALRQRLGAAFNFVTTFSFSFVALLMIAYLVLLGPLDYWLVHRVLRRPAWAWVTFPLLVLLVSGGAYWIGSAAKGGSTRLNQMELVDVDMASGQVRGTYWAALYSPRSERFNLALKRKAPQKGLRAAGSDGATADAATEPTPQTLLSWWGLPGSGVGGMQAGGAANLGISGPGYRYSPDLSGLEDVPVLASGTKSFAARWTDRVAPLLDGASQITTSADGSGPAGDVLVEGSLADDDGLLSGSLTNRSGKQWRNTRLLFGNWAYRLGNIPDGGRVDIGPQLAPIGVKTLVTRAARGTLTATTGEADREPLDVDRASRAQILNLMMFFEAAGGQAFARLPHEYQSFSDLSRLLQLGRAILVAETDGPVMELVDPSTGEVFTGNKDLGTVVYRFILPVEAAEEAGAVEPAR